MNIPEPLRQRGSFCCWQYAEKNGRKTKTPYDPSISHRAQTNNPRTFVDFESVRQMSQNYDGIGFLITDRLFVIDCDHCSNVDGSLSKPVDDIVKMFNVCYMEFWPFGATATGATPRTPEILNRHCPASRGSSARVPTLVRT